MINFPLSWEHMRLHWKLAELLKKRRIGQREFAKITGLSFPTINALGNNKSTQWREETIVVLMKYFGFKKLDQLIEFIPDESEVTAQ